MEEENSFEYPKCYDKTQQFMLCLYSLDQKTDIANLFQYRSFRELSTQPCLDKFKNWKKCVEKEYPIVKLDCNS